MQLHAIITVEPLESGAPFYVAQAVEIDVASQGASEEEALANLREAVEGVLEVASPREIARRLREGARVAALEVPGEAGEALRAAA
jgi:predicted RNase H-like HicB family nuclease